MKYLNKKFSVYLSGNKTYEKNYNKIFKRADNGKDDESKRVWVVAIRSTDGYYIPEIVAKSRKAALRAFEEFKKKEQHNSYWNFSHEPLVTSALFIEEDVE